MPRGLMDTHTFIWFSLNDPQLSQVARRFLMDGRNERLLSIASIWEMAIKAKTGKLDLKQPLDQFLAQHLIPLRISILPIHLTHTLQVWQLPSPHIDHKDPFDRLIISQSLVENLLIIGCDNKFDAYGIQRIW